MSWMNRRTGQTGLEYVLLIICAVGAFLAILHYGQRGVQGRLRKSFDEIGYHYEPGTTSGQMTTTVKRISTTTVELHQPLTLFGREGYGTHISEDIELDETTRQGSESTSGF